MIFPSLSTPLSLLVFPGAIGFLGSGLLAGRIAFKGTSDHDTYAGRDVRTVRDEEEVVGEVADDDGNEGAVGVAVAELLLLLFFLLLVLFCTWSTYEPLLLLFLLLFLLLLLPLLLLFLLLLLPVSVSVSVSVSVICFLFVSRATIRATGVPLNRAAVTARRAHRMLALRAPM